MTERKFVERGSLWIRPPTPGEPIETWDAFMSKMAERAPYEEDCADMLESIQDDYEYARELDREKKAREANIDMPATKAFIGERFGFLEAIGFARAVVADEPQRYELLYTNQRARRSVRIEAEYCDDASAALHVDIANRDGGGFPLLDWMYHRGGRLYDPVSFRLEMNDKVEHVAQILEAEARSDMKDILAGRAWEEVPEPDFSKLMQDIRLP